MEANGRILNVPHYLNYPRPSTEAEESDQVGGGEEGDEEEAEDDIDLDLRKNINVDENDDMDPFGAVLACFERLQFCFYFSFS